MIGVEGDMIVLRGCMIGVGTPLKKTALMRTARGMVFKRYKFFQPGAVSRLQTLFLVHSKI